MLTPQPDRQIALNSDKLSNGLAPRGALEIVPAQSDLFARWSVDKENLLVAVEPQRLRRLAALEFEKDAFEFEPPKLGYVDKRALAVAHLIRDELLLDPPPEDVCLDSLLTVFATFLLRHHSSIGHRSRSVPKGGLSPRRLRRVTDFMQAHLGENITIEQMAEIAQMSPSHFQRVFRESTGLPPHQYLISMRLAYVRHLITTTGTPLNEIARLAGFHSHSHMSATMRRMWGISPSAFRSEK